MIIGGFFEWAAGVTVVAALLSQMLYLRYGEEQFGRWARWSTLATVVAINLAFFTLVLYFMTSRLDIEYVFSYTRSDYPWYFKLVGTWGAQKGTILMWTAMTGWSLAWLLWTDRKAKDGDTKTVQAWTLLFTLLMYALFLTLVLRQDTFALTGERFLASRPLGNGLNPVLLSPWIIIHPPAEFLGYALVTVPAAAAMAYIVTGKRAWAKRVRTESRVAWAFYTLGLSLGAIWAYYTLSFGGYWAWDPVETANFIPWLWLTAYLHTRAHHEKFGTYKVLAPVLAIGAYWFTLFQTVATRSGLWVSVHAFTDPTGTFAQDPFLRFANIINADPSVAAIVGVMGSLFFLAFALTVRRTAADRPILRYGYGGLAFAASGAFLLAPSTATGLAWEASALLGFGNTQIGSVVFVGLLAAVAALPLFLRKRPEGEGDDDEQDASLFSFQGQLYWGSLAIITATLVTTILILRGVNGMNRQVFDDWAPIVGLPIILLMVPLFSYGRIAVRVQAALMGVGLAGALAGGFLYDPWAIGVVIPPLLVAGLLGVWRLIDVIAPARLATPVRAATAVLVVGILADFVFWSNMPARFVIGPLGFPLPSALQIPGLLATAAAFLLLPTIGIGRNRTALRILAVAEIILLGHGISVLTGIAALVLSTRPEWQDDGLKTAFLARLPNFRGVGMFLLHVALVFGLIGYAFSTYGAEEASPRPILGLGDTVTVGDLTLRFTDTDMHYDAAHGFVTQFTSHIEAERDGTLVGTGQVAFHWVDQVQHYDPDTRVLRMAGEDLYIASLAFCRDPSGTCRLDVDWVEAHENGVDHLQTSETVTALVFSAKVLPMMGMLWSALPMFLFGIALLLLGQVPVRHRLPAPKPRVDLDAQLEAELDRALAEETP